jgi:hypothetical protein
MFAPVGGGSSVIVRPGRLVLTVAMLVTTALLAACIKPTTFNPYAAPDHGELDRLQKIINGRADLEPIRDELIRMDGKIRATIAKHSPDTVVGRSLPKVGNGCSDPFGHNIGATYAIEEIYARPGPTAEQWQQIMADLEPAFAAANFHLNFPPTVIAPQGSDPQIRDDGATIDLISHPGVLAYGYSTGCHLPASWRTGQPPADLRPAQDEGAHYPYLYGPPGGRTGPA